MHNFPQAPTAHKREKKSSGPPYTSRCFVVQLQFFCRGQIGLKFVGSSACRIEILIVYTKQLTAGITSDPMRFSTKMRKKLLQNVVWKTWKQRSLQTKFRKQSVWTIIINNVNVSNALLAVAHVNPFQCKYSECLANASMADCPVAAQFSFVSTVLFWQLSWRFIHNISTA